MHSGTNSCFPGESHLRAHRGTTLVEILGVMIIIAILMALVLGISASVGRAQDKARAETHMAYLRTMIEEYKQKERQLPVHQTVNGTPTLCFRSSQDLDMIEEAQDELGIQFANTALARMTGCDQLRNVSGERIDDLFRRF